MINDRQLLESIIDNIDDGIIYINKIKKIEIINKTAKDILGIALTTDNAHSHPSGKIKNGDIVIIADNSLGDDDGNMKPEDLSIININDKDIKTGDMIIGIGVYGNSGIKSIYKYFRKNQAAKQFSLNTKYLGYSIKAYIDISSKIISINVEGIDYKMSYINSVGHMVIIDGKTGMIKFYQAKGYTVRKEPIYNILRGNSYLSKGNKGENIQVIGKSLDEIIEYSNMTEKINNILAGNFNIICNKFYEINKRPTICSLCPVKESDRVEGVILKIRDISELNKMLSDRNKIIEDMEKIHTIYAPMPHELPEDAFSDFIGNSPVINEVKYLAFRASKIKSNIILTGESGTGKSKLAEEIHKLYKKNAPFVEVNCSSIPQNLFESELFGYVPGAFTGALTTGKTGYFEMADGGTIFLDEIAEIPIEIQVKLLYVLQNKKFYKIGSAKPVNIDVRVITATNKDLKEEVENGNFRQDLYYRINVFPIHIPPLRDRKTDIYILLNKLVTKLCNNYNLKIKQFSGEALNKIMNYSWPGNIRQLENVIERAIALCDTNLIYPEHINISVDTKEDISLKYILHKAEKEAIEEAIIKYGKNKNLIMQKLNISKSALYDKINKYNIDF